MEDVKYTVVDCCLNCDFRLYKGERSAVMCGRDNRKKSGRLICNYYKKTTNNMITGGEKKILKEAYKDS